ncbi:malonyl-CoA decarboxylase [Acidocella aquatica]|uniref:malonyl-CoA decarboxylase n=1 Tax=Acidocella aquatica TaxID=1922313 RepID=UPI0024E0E7C9|nr:malonyl-CoA decarboxylase [Acidocella aquatica]
MSNQSKSAPLRSILHPRSARAWLERLWPAIAERGRKFAPIPATDINPLERARQLAVSLLSERGEAAGAAIARELLEVLGGLAHEQRGAFYAYLAEAFEPDQEALKAAANSYLTAPSADTAAVLAERAEPPRQELMRRINMAQGGTAALVRMRKELPEHMAGHPELKRVDADLKHLFASWFNRGFLEMRQIDWQTPAAILEKLIAYEAVHEIQGWDDLRRRLAADRRCFAFFHPALPGDPLIFVEVALVKGLAESVRALLERDTDEAAQLRRANEADTAIFYSISNCQDGLRGISFGNFLIKQVVEELRIGLPWIQQFSTLSPIPGFRRWLGVRLKANDLSGFTLSEAEGSALFSATGMPYEAERPLACVRAAISNESWVNMSAFAQALRPALVRLCAMYLTESGTGGWRPDSVAKFHLGNGARLERINWMGNPGKRGIDESYGLMVNYLYDPATIEANHEAFTKEGVVACSAAVTALLTPAAAVLAVPKLALTTRRGKKG